MNDGMTARAEGFAVQLDVDGRDLQLIDPAGGTLRALMAVLPEIDPALELGADIREVCKAQILSPAPANIAANGRVKADDGQLWKIVKRVDNPADFTIDLYLVKITEQDA